MAVAPERDARLGPALADMAHEPAQMGAHFDARRRLAGAQHDRDGTALLGVIDMDRQKAALVIMGVEQRELLMAVHDIAGVVDIESDARRARIRRRPSMDRRARRSGGSRPSATAHSPAATGSAGNTGRARVGQPSAGELECRIAAQNVEIVGVLVAAADRKRCGRGSCRRRMGDARADRADRESSAPGAPRPQAPLGHRQQHHAAIRGQSAAIKSGCDFLALDGWKRERRRLSLVMASAWRAQTSAKDWCKQPNPTLYQALTLRSPASKHARHE